MVRFTNLRQRWGSAWRLALPRSGFVQRKVLLRAVGRELASVRQQQLTWGEGHRWSRWLHSATRGSVSRRVFYVCTGKPKLGASRIAMTAQAVLSATDAAQLTTGAGTTLPTVAEFLAETLAPL